jgi:site-specific DNA recombinase
VRRIFRLCADGAGLTRITKLLNADGALSPRAQRGRPQAWAASLVRAILLRSLYRGEIVWNQTKKRDDWGQQRQKDRPASEWLRVPAPELRIIDEALWQAAQRQLAARRLRSGNQVGVDRRCARGLPQDRESRYLLTNFARCGCCGGSLVAHTRSHGGHRAAFYGCLTYWKKGKTRCPNGLAGRMEVIDAEVLDTLKEDILRPTVVERAIELALDELTPAVDSAAVGRRDSEIAALETECARLADAIARGGRLDVLLRTLEDRQNRLSALRADQQAAQALDRPTFNRRGTEAQLRYLLQDWRGLLTRDVASGREVLRTLLAEPLTFTPVIDGRRRGYRFEGSIALDRLVSKAVTLPTLGTSPTGLAETYLERPIMGDTRAA